MQFEILDGRYQLQDQIGRGGMATIYRVDGDNPVAIAMQHIQDPPTPPRQYNPTIPPALEEIILRCLEKVPEMRFRDGSQLARALETLAANRKGISV